MPRGHYDRSHRRKQLALTTEELWKLYQSLTLDELSRITSIGRGLIARRLRQSGYRLRPPRVTFRKKQNLTGEGTWDKYPIHSYREPPCGRDYPLCRALKDYFMRQDNDPRAMMDDRERVLELWENVLGEPEQKSDGEPLPTESEECYDDFGCIVEKEGRL